MYKKIGIIGFGNMGQAIAERIKTAYKVSVFDKDNNKTKEIRGLRVAENIQDLVKSNEVVILAVKPQDFYGVLKEIKDVAMDKLVISIAAGVTLDYMESILGQGISIIRAMPNLSALVSASVTALSSNKIATERDMNFSQKLFRAIGTVVMVPESQMNAITAISGSGPALLVYLMDDLKEKALFKVFFAEAVHFGIEPKIAKVLVKRTIEGTKKILRDYFDYEPDDLIQRVCSRGGTTEAGMEVLKKKGNTKEALSEAIRAACKRAEELSKS